MQNMLEDSQLDPREADLDVPSSDRCGSVTILLHFGNDQGVEFVFGGRPLVCEVRDEASALAPCSKLLARPARSAL